MKVRFLVRRDDPTRFWGKLTGGDLVFLFLSLFPPWLIWAVTPLPLPVCFAICVGPALYYVIRFRAGRPEGYFHHWLRFQLRPKLWRFGTQHADSIIGVRNQWQFCARPLLEIDGRPEPWLGVGFSRLTPRKQEALLRRPSGTET